MAQSDPQAREDVAKRWKIQCFDGGIPVTEEVETCHILHSELPAKHLAPLFAKHPRITEIKIRPA